MEFAQCSNCGRNVPKANLLTHEPFCVRNLKLCTHCGYNVPQAEFDAHYETCVSGKLEAAQEGTEDDMSSEDQKGDQAGAAENSIDDTPARVQTADMSVGTDGSLIFARAARDLALEESTEGTQTASVGTSTSPSPRPPSGASTGSGKSRRRGTGPTPSPPPVGNSNSAGSQTGSAGAAPPRRRPTRPSGGSGTTTNTDTDANGKQYNTRVAASKTRRKRGGQHKPPTTPPVVHTTALVDGDEEEEELARAMSESLSLSLSEGSQGAVYARLAQNSAQLDTDTHAAASHSPSSSYDDDEDEDDEDGNDDDDDDGDDDDDAVGKGPLRPLVRNALNAHTPLQAKQPNSRHTRPYRPSGAATSGSTNVRARPPSRDLVHEEYLGFEQGFRVRRFDDE